MIAELTATTRTGVGRFRYPRNGWPALFHVRSGASLAGNYAATLQIEDNTTITGSATSGGFCGKKNLYTVYFAMKFSQPFSSYGTWDGYAVYPGSHSMNSSYSGGYVGFPAGSVLEVRTALSYVSVDGARANLDAEGGASFDDIRAATSSEWNAALSRIAVAGRGPGDVDTFYTCLYRSLLHPNTFNDVDGRYIGFDGVIHSVASGHTHYANFSDWDTYRSLAPLQGLLFPQRASDMIQSLVTDAEQSGAYPRWALANSATGMMSGDSVVPLIVNLYAFGARDFDLKSALHYMVNAATQGGVGLDGFLERPGIAAYLRLGYGPQTAEFRANGRIAGASVTLEWSSMTLPSPDSLIRWAIPQLPPSSRTGRSIGRTCSIPPPAISRPGARPVSSPTVPGSWHTPRALGRTDTTRATPNNTCGGCRITWPVW